MSQFLKRRSPTEVQRTSTQPHAASQALVPYGSRNSPQLEASPVERYSAEYSHTASHSHSSLISGLRGMVGGAVEVTMSRSTVIYDGQSTYVEAEEQQLRGGRWEQQRVEGVWEGDQSREAIQRLSRRSQARQSLKQRPLPRVKKW